MTLVWPQALLLGLPLGLLLWRAGRVRGPALALRCALVAVLVLALARPELRRRDAGSDVVVVVDRSNSMPEGSEAQAEELARLLAPQRRPADRLAVVSFGRDARVEQPLSRDVVFGGFGSRVDGEASNLSLGLDTAGALIPAERAGRVLVLSDGRATGLDARAAARRLAARGIAVDARWLGREDSALDVAVTALQVPPSVATREPFLLTASLRASRATRAMLVLTRGRTTLARVERALPQGSTVVTFRDLVEAPGLASYELRASAAEDGVPENDVGRAVVRIDGPTRVLVLTARPEGALVQSLRAADIDLDVRPPGALGMEALENVGAVVLEDVEASRLGESGLRVLAQYVREAGGGLLMTGGRRSFGEGGYRKSAVEDVLPVSLEVREEQRKAAVAISIILDCSGSMGATVPDGRTKMALAAEGVVGALQLLNPRDEASVHMVDTAAHEIFPMSSVSEGLPLNQVARGFSGGGGIYVGVGLRTARKEVLSSQKATRHVVLFSDAADSEEPDDYQRTLADLTGQGVTVSVIGLGRSTDSDAELLRDVARRGNGRVYFAEDATSLPRIFSEETIAVARSSYVEGEVGTKAGPDWSLLGRLPPLAPPTLGGYNLTYARPSAAVALRSADDNAAPLLALWPQGAGRVAALMVEVDGKYSGGFLGWPSRKALLEQVVRWVTSASSLGPEAVGRAVLSGDDLHVTLDFDGQAAPLAGSPTLVLLSGDARTAPVELPMRWEDDERVGAHFVLPGTGTWHPVVKVGDRVFRAAPVTLPWAPEFEPGSALEGRALLQAVARAGGGIERLAMTGLFADASESEGVVPLAPPLVVLALLLLVTEVAARRFWARGRTSRRKAAAQVQVQASVSAATVAAAAVSPRAASRGPEQEPRSPARSNVAEVLSSARERAKRRTRS